MNLGTWMLKTRAQVIRTVRETRRFSIVIQMLCYQAFHHYQVFQISSITLD